MNSIQLLAPNRCPGTPLFHAGAVVETLVSGKQLFMGRGGAARRPEWVGVLATSGPSLVMQWKVGEVRSRCHAGLLAGTAVVDRRAARQTFRAEGLGTPAAAS
jgi:hypothetical protein